MRSLISLSAVVAVATAQNSFSFVTSEVASSIENVEPTATETISGPIQTGRACAQVAGLVEDSSLTFPSVQAELAYACLKSVPIDTESATTTVNSLKQMVQFQSTVTYLKEPPQGFPNAGVDLLAGLDDISRKVSSGEYTNEYDFENDIATLFIKAHDGHLNFNGMAYAGAFRWRRNRQIALISASRDGSEAPKVWAVQDFNSTGAGFDPSPVSKIDGKDATQFLEEESLLNAYHDPDTRYNAMFYMQPAENFGYFTNPRFYPGPKVSVTFENGTTNEYDNSATVVDSGAWSSVSDGATFYETFIYPSTSSKIKKRSPHRLPHHLENPRDAELDRRYVPVNYPRAAVEHSADDVGLAGFFINTGAGDVGVLMAQTFNTENNADAREFQSVVQTYIEEAKSRGVTKHIIDLRTNGGGKILLGYDTYKQFFPSQNPQLMSRYRGHEASAKFGESLSSFTAITNYNAELYTSPFNYHAYLNSDLQAFNSWQDMYPPAKFNDDSFTNLLRYNLSDPYTTSSNRLSIGVTITGYADRSNFTEDPFAAEDIVILSDGICASTCSLFTELMVQQSKVRTIAIGGRPSGGPMQPVGGTKGSLVLQSDYLVALSAYVVSNFANSRTEANEMVDYLPNPFGIQVQDASINFQDNIRRGLEKDGIPTQFLNDTASCRLWYQPNMYLNVTAVWSKVAEVAFGNDGKLDGDACVAGSVTTTEQQRGQGEGNPTQGGNGNSEPTKSKAAAPGMVRPAGEGWMAVAVCGVVVLGSMGFGASLI